jgi:hypothetical protein
MIPDRCDMRFVSSKLYFSTTSRSNVSVQILWCDFSFAFNDFLIFFFFCSVFLYLAVMV